ncbi:MAG: ATP-binding protein [Deltaproteobacteria bacterium]|nr:ATP-binding protein [Deltaproteobacteria bacterium]
MQELPSAGQAFNKIRKLNMLYVDKTEYIGEMIKSEGCFFLSRPRRFGKSLLLGTMRELFGGRRDLFEGLWIGSSGYDFKPFPVVCLSLAASGRTTEGLRNTISVRLIEAASDNGLDLNDEAKKRGLRFDAQAPGDLLLVLVNALTAKTGLQAVVLIDEYDAPVQSVISEPGQAERIRDVLHDFYSVLKLLADQDKIKFLFVTGITRFAKASFFSVFNNCEDLTLNPEYAGICGFSLAEFEASLAPYLPGILEYNKSEDLLPASTDLEEFRRMVLDFYDGYSWDGKTRILNPYSLIQFLKSKELLSFWYESGTPTFLFDLIRNNPHEFAWSDSYHLSRFSLSNVDIGNMSLVPLLFQTGYLTIEKKISSNDFMVREPNGEVTDSFNLGLLMAMTDRTAKNIDDLKNDIGQALRDADPGLLARSLETVLGWFPFRLHISLEYYYHSIFLSILKMLRYKVKAEVNEALGIIDLVLEYSSRRVYIMEIKFEAPKAQETGESPGDGSVTAEPTGTDKPKRTRRTGKKLPAILRRLLKSAKDQMASNRYDARYRDEFEMVHRVAVAVAGRTSVAVEIY